MPNWCYNTVTLSHDDITKIDALDAELSKEHTEVFNHLRPRPESEADNWYSWNCNNWGTKWDVSPSDWERVDTNTIRIHFDSAWSPPSALYEYLDFNEWSVYALYHEPGMGFAGMFEDGQDTYYEFDYSDRSSIENLPDEILDYTNVMEDLENYEEEQLQESCEELERTEWFDKKVKPAYVGRYEIMTKEYQIPQYCNWDGKTWSRWEGDKVKVLQWRGLVEEHSSEKWDPVAELDKIVVTL